MQEGIAFGVVSAKIALVSARYEGQVRGIEYLL
jgi:hypothetical protein